MKTITFVAFFGTITAMLAGFRTLIQDAHRALFGRANNALAIAVAP